jgi:C-22 sterol desaturase
MAANATSSPLATIKFGAANVAPQLEYVVDYVSNASAWTILATVLAVLVVYDQCTLAVDNLRNTRQPPLT